VRVLLVSVRGVPARIGAAVVTAASALASGGLSRFEYIDGKQKNIKGIEVVRPRAFCRLSESLLVCVAQILDSSLRWRRRFATEANFFDATVDGVSANSNGLNPG
jgi:hypothetical protein